MADYVQLKSRHDAHEIILLDGAIGTQLQHMRAPMNNQAWAAAALDTHPFTVRRLHENYIRASLRLTPIPQVGTIWSLLVWVIDSRS